MGFKELIPKEDIIEKSEALLNKDFSKLVKNLYTKEKNKQELTLFLNEKGESLEKIEKELEKKTLPQKNFLEKVCIFFDVNEDYFLPGYSIFIIERMKKMEVSPKEISILTGITERSIYSYISGDRAPCLKNIYILSELFNEKIENILVYSKEEKEKTKINNKLELFMHFFYSLSEKEQKQAKELIKSIIL